MVDFLLYCKDIFKELKTSAECSTRAVEDASWLSQTRRSLTIGFLDLNFASRRKLYKNSVYYENMNTVAFILFGKDFIFTCFCSFSFSQVHIPSFSDVSILWDSVPDLKISTRSVTVNFFNRLRRNFFWPEEVGVRSGNWLICHRG